MCQGSPFLICCSDKGKVAVLRMDREQPSYVFRKYDEFPAFSSNKNERLSCLDVDEHQMRAVVGSESGLISFVDLKSEKGRYDFGTRSGDCSAISSVKFLSPFVVAAASRSALRILDFRQNILADSFSVPLRSSPFVSLAKHPNLDTLATGAENGSIFLWDRRHPRPVVSLATGHSAAVWDLAFYQDASNYLISCGEDGELLSWKFSNLTPTQDLMDERSVHLSSIIRNGTPLNSFSISTTFRILVTCTDSESVVVVPDFHP